MKKEILKTKSIKKSFTEKAVPIEVLKGIDFTAYEGEIIAVTGASGVGKSTFLHIIGTLESPSEGEILYNFDYQINPLKLSPDEISEFRNRHIGFVFQFHYLLPEFSVLENVIMPGLISKEFKNPKPTGDRKFHDNINEKDSVQKLKDHAMEILKNLGIANRSAHRPGELSGGEQQRVAVARALFKKPSIILADEPTGNLDSKSAHELFELFRKVNEEHKTTFVIVTHNEVLAQKCDRKLKMIDGILLSDN